MNNEAVSPVIAAVMLFALFTTASLLWSLNTLPELVADRELSNQDEVRESMANLKSSVEALSAAGDFGVVSDSFRLGAKPVALVQPSPATGAITVGDTMQVAGAFSSGELMSLDGHIPSTINPALGTGTFTLSEVATVQGLAVRVGPTDGTAGTPSTISVTATGNLGDFVLAEVRVGTGTTCPSGAEVRLTGTAFGSAAVTKSIACGVSDPRGFEVLLTEQHYGFTSGLKNLAKPITITMEQTTNTPVWDYAATWTTPDGALRAFGSGVASADMPAIDSSRALYEPSNTRFYNQDIIWEGGAILSAQDGDAAINVNPGFQLGFEGSTGYLVWTIHDIQGEGNLGGHSLVTMTAKHAGTSQAVYKATGASMTVTSDYANAWNSFFGQSIALGGLSGDEACQEYVPGSHITLHLGSNVDGKGCDASINAATITEWIISIRIIDIEVTIQ